jgi:hypothetical protein
MLERMESTPIPSHGSPPNLPDETLAGFRVWVRVMGFQVSESYFGCVVNNPAGEKSSQSFPQEFECKTYRQLL